MNRVLDQLLEARSLTVEEAEAMLVDITSGQRDPILVGGLLTALRAKGETAAEVRGMSNGMRRQALRPSLDGSGAVDVVGTGGDGSGSLNLSTGAALLAAACGVPVIKHGNRAMSSKSGSADVLEELGVPIPMREEEAGRFFARHGFTFLFAPYYHPSVGEVVPIRRALGVRTVFNLLGPLANPGRPEFAVIGAWDLPTARLMAGALAGGDMSRAFVVHGHNGWDEPTPIGPFTLLDVNGSAVIEIQVDPADLGLDRCEADDLKGGSPAENAEAIRDAFAGQMGPHRDALALGAALALEVSGAVETLSAGLALAFEAIDSDAATDLLAGIASP